MAKWGRIAGGIATAGLSEAAKGYGKAVYGATEKPEKQYYGDSEYEYKMQQAAAKQGVLDADQLTAEGIERANTAADAADTRYGRLEGDVAAYGNVQQTEAQQADKGFDRSMSDYQSGRGAVLDNAGRIERDAAGLAKTYQTTADRQFQLNQARAERAAMAQGARGGAGGLRTAIASQTQAGADAMAQAEITRANEMNQLAQMRQNAYATAAGIRQGQGAQDQSAGNIYAGRQQNAYGNQAGSFGQRAGIIGERNAAQQGAAQLSAGTGVAQQGNYLGAQTAMETAQLNAAREKEQQDIERSDKVWGRLRDPFGVKGG